MAEPSASSASNPSYEDLAEAWNTICQLLGADGPDEAIARIQTLTDQMEALDNREDLPDELITLSEFEQVLTRLHQKIADLRARNSTLEARLDTLTQETDDDASAHALLDALDAPTYQDALSHIQALQDKAEARYAAQEALQSTGHDNIGSLIDAAKALQRENDRLRSQVQSTAPDTEVLQSASAIRMVLGISNIEEAEEFVGRLDALSTSVRRALDHLGMDVPAALSVDRADNVASYLDVLASQIERLAEAPLPDDDMLAAADTLNAIETTLGISSAEDAREMESMVRSLTEDLEALAHEREVLREEGLTAEEAVSMIHSMEDQLDDLYVNQDVNASNGTLPPGLKDTLGVESIEEAQRVVEHTKEMDTQIATLYEEQEQLNELGIDSIDEAIRMIRDMNDQLVELYEDVEARSEAQALPGANQDTFQQLESLYARQEKLQSELGISDPEAIIQMVEDMNVQLETLYEDRDASLASSQDALVDPEALNNPDLSNTERLEKLIDSMARQLDVLYSEKETLSEEGFSSADEAATRIADLRDEIKALRNQKAAAQDQPDVDVAPDLVREWRALKEDLGVSSPDDVRALIASSHADATEPASTEEPADTTSVEAVSSDEADRTSTRTQPGPQWSAGPALADAELRAALPTMDADDRDALDLAVIQLDAEGQVRTLNDAAYALPMFDRLRSKEDAKNTAFFFDIAPSAATDAFYGRFHAGLEHEHLDARFPHLFTASSHPPFVALVHLFYDDGTETAWVLLRTA